MRRFGVKEVEGVVRGREVTIHAVRHESLGVVHMGGGLPGAVGELDFVTGSTESRRRGAHHGVVGNAEKRKRDNDTQGDE